MLRSPYLEPGLAAATERLMRALQPALVAAAALFSLLVWLPAVHRRLPATAVFPAQACALALLYLTALHMAGFPLARYATPFRPELYAVACAALALALAALRRPSPGPGTP